MPPNSSPIESHTLRLEALAKSLSSIAALQSEIRATHLQAHLEQAEILNAAQAMKYGYLRGYDDNGAPSRHKH